MPSPSTNLYPDFSLLAKPTGAACNLACQYCFYLGKQELYPESNLQMPEEVLKAYIKQLLGSHKNREVSIAWQGGEPTLMGLDFFQLSVELAKKYQKPGQKIIYSMQTNGMLLTDEWCAWLKKHDFLIGLSMDGTPDMHNAFRVNKAGMGSFDQVRRGWNLLQKHQVDTNILCAVHAANASRPLETYRFFRDILHARFIQFIPVVERLDNYATSQGKKDGRPHQTGQVSERSVKPEQYGTFLIEILEEWVQHDVGDVFIQSFDAALASWCRLPASVCTFQEVCGASLILEHNGDLYSCDHFVEPSHRLGNILERPMVELVRSSQQRQFGLAKRDRLPAYCQKCDVLFACHGECPRNRFTQTSEGEQGLNYLCPSYKLFFHYVDRPMHIMAELLRRGRAASEIMHGIV